MARRLTGASVLGLLGRFDHEVNFPEDWEFTIIHGPNGVGKTRFLEIIANTFALRSTRLFDIPFRSAFFRFSDDSSLELLKGSQDPLPLTSDVTDQDGTLQYRLEVANRPPLTWMVNRRGDLPLRAVRQAERYLPIEQVGPDLWVDHRAGDYITIAEAVDRYPEELPFDPGDRRPPSELREFVNELGVHLIETQRLLTFEARPRTPGNRRHSQRPTVLQFAEDLTRRIGEALARNSRTSQELDRTFPRRVLTAVLPSHVTDEEIQGRYQSQSDLRQRLAEISVLDQSADVPLPDKTLQPWERRVLWTYLEDSERKLATFQTLLDRVRLLREIVNARFLFKELIIDAERGFRFITDDKTEVGPEQLSSGEQHELVLLYDLLFNVSANSLVLVDEPEISLHVAWQQQFLNDMRRIATLADLQFIVATHSPQVIHTWWDRTVALYRGGNGSGPDRQD